MRKFKHNKTDIMAVQYVNGGEYYSYDKEVNETAYPIRMIENTRDWIEIEVDVYESIDADYNESFGGRKTMKQIIKYYLGITKEQLEIISFGKEKVIRLRDIITLLKNRGLLFTKKDIISGKN